jgi:hypothetical protein
MGRPILAAPFPDVPNFDSELLGHLLSGFVAMTPMIDPDGLNSSVYGVRASAPTELFSWFIVCFSQTNKSVSRFSGNGSPHGKKGMNLRYRFLAECADWTQYLRNEVQFVRNNAQLKKWIQISPSRPSFLRKFESSLICSEVP